MTRHKTALVVGGTTGIGRAVAHALALRGEATILTGRDAARSAAAAAEIGHGAEGLALDLTEPASIGAALEGLGPIDHLVIAAIERDQNSIKDYNVARALKLVTLKLVGYAEVVHALASRLTPQASIVMLGGLAKERPYPGSTTISTVNGGITSMVHTLAVELGPVRVNGLHPGIVGDTAAWSGRPPEVLAEVIARTPAGRLATTQDVSDAILFLLDNPAVNGVNLVLDGGWLLR